MYVNDQTMRSMFVQETNKVEQLIYFIRNMFKGVEVGYQKIKRLALAVVVTARKLKP